MEIFKIENLSFKYPESETNILRNINLSINAGEFIVFGGKSGCGKTTLLRLLKSELTPYGEINGQIYFKDKPLCEWNSEEQAEKIGFVMQNPESGIVTDKVWHELAFGLENIGVPAEEMKIRIAETVSFFGMEKLFEKSVNELSGGQKQILNLASVMALGPDVLILDEPTSQLDPVATSEFLNNLNKINKELGVTVIISEHNLEEVLNYSDRVVILDNGEIISEGNAVETAEKLKKLKHEMFFSLPTPMRVYHSVESSLPCPVSVRDGRGFLEEYSLSHKLKSLTPKENESSESTLIEMKNIYFRYEKNGEDILKDLSLTVNKGEIITVAGGNGTGKSTFLTVLGGINVPYSGKVLIKGKKLSEHKNLYKSFITYLPQNPDSLFVKSTVEEELFDSLKDYDFSREEKEEKVNSIISLCNIENIIKRNPFDLSGGEKQRVGLGKVLLRSPEILLLDEPTKGFDASFKKRFGDILKNLKMQNVTTIIVSHDVEFCAEYSDRCALLSGGSFVSVETPRKFFAGKNFYTTSANKMARNIISGVILAQDIIDCCNGVPFEPEKPEIAPSDFEEKKPYKKEAEKKAKKINLFSVLFPLIAIPLTIFAGIHFFGGRKYYLISLLIILETFISFFYEFESRKGRAKEIVIISLMCALAVGGRIIFTPFSQFKPMLPIIILTGVCLGKNAGFLTGAISGFVSNFFFGQGPWTPWQMLGFGMVGFVAGIIFGGEKIKKNTVLMMLFGFLATIIIYGGITNPQFVLTNYDSPTFEMIKASYIAGFSFDLTHGLSTAFFLLFITKPITNKLERLKIKYGIFK